MDAIAVYGAEWLLTIMASKQVRTALVSVLEARRARLASENR